MVYNMATKKRRWGCFRILGILFLVGLVTFIWWLMPRLAILTGYAAKETCSCVFVADRSEAITKLEDAGYFPISLASTDIDFENKIVTSSLLGLGTKTAIYRAGLGCALKGDTEIQTIQNQGYSPPIIPRPDSLYFPYGTQLVDTIPNNVDTAQIQKALDLGFESKGTRAIVAIYNNQIIGERYTFDKDTRLLGWSMTKSITGSLIGILVKEGKLKIHEPPPIPAWQKDDRKHIHLHHLMQMSSGLKWWEFYFDLSNATKMLYKSSDYGKYAMEQPAEFPPDSVWEYSSGTTNILSEIIEQQFDNQQDAQQFARTALFNKLGMNSMIIEADASGTHIGSSFGWATPRDWARYGLLHLNDGVWNGERILPEGWVEYVTTPARQSEGKYGGQIWLNHSKHFLPDNPSDTYMFNGFNGQHVIVIPSRNVVIVKMGLDSMGGVDLNKLVTEILKGIQDK